MTNIYFTYRYRKDNKGNRYTPSHEWGDSYPEWLGMATITDERINTNLPMGKRLGWIEADDSLSQEVIDELINYGKYGGLIYITNEQALAYMKGYTDYSETEPGKFEILAADEEMETEAEYLIIT